MREAGARVGIAGEKKPGPIVLLAHASSCPPFPHYLVEAAMRTITMMILVLCPCVHAYAQEEIPRDRFEVRGIAGWSGFADESLIHHGALGGMTDVRLKGGLRIGPEVLYHIGPRKDRDVSLLLVSSYDFRRLKRVSPFVSWGGGMLIHSDGRQWHSSYTYGGGTGVKFSISKQLFVAPEIRVGWEPALRVMGSLGYRF